MTMVGIDLLHPEDVLLFAEVASAMRRVANKHGLNLRSVGHLPDEKVGFDTDRWGDCDRHGNIRLLLRAKVNGQWTTERLSDEEIWRVAAHELAHLRYYEHTDKHRELSEELEFALSNQQESHRKKLLRKLVKMQAQRDSEQKIGNLEAADAFARMINKMLIENELNPTDIDYARADEDDPVIEVKVDMPRFGIKQKMMRSEWEEALAHVVAEAHLCRILVRSRSNQIYFVGTRSHATVAEYAYGVLLPAADQMAEKAYVRYYEELFKTGDTSGIRGFKKSWLEAFIQRIDQRFQEERRAAVAEAAARHTAMGADPGTAMIRLDGALMKVRKYIDDKFTSKKRAASFSSTRYVTNAEGARQGREAADAMTIGRRGIGSAAVKGVLKS